MTFLEVLATSSIVAAGVTALVNRQFKRSDDTALRAATLEAIAAEIDMARKFATDYLAPGAVRVPMHRIATSIYEKGLPQLVALGGLSRERVQALMTYYNNIDQMNRSLEQLHGSNGDRQREVRLTLLKACSLVASADLEKVLLREQGPVERRIISKKRAKYAGRSPYDRVKAALE